MASITAVVNSPIWTYVDIVGRQCICQKGKLEGILGFLSKGNIQKRSET